MGKMITEAGMADEAVIEKTVKKVVPPKKSHLIDANLKALKIGMSQ